VIDAGARSQHRGGTCRRAVERMVAARLLAALAVCSVALAACGSSSKPTSSSTPSGSGSALNQAVRFAHCMRSSGVKNYPDPSSSGRPQSLNQIDPNSPTFTTAYAACRRYASNGAGAPPEPSPTELRRALAFAGCVRTHGFPQFPDPLTTVSLQATFTLGPGMYFPVNGNYQVQSPTFMHAAKVCGVQLPQLPPAP
jgi:hypothetical protein